MNPKNFQPHAPGQVIKTLSGYWAFIPQPLPPAAAWSEQLLTHLSNADRSLARLAEIGRGFPAPHIAIRPFVRREAVLSSRIEGTHTSFEGLLTHEASPADDSAADRDAQEVQNYVKALDYGLAALTRLPISLRLLCELHRELMASQRAAHLTPGEVRRSQNWIGPAGATLQTARFVPPPAEGLPECLTALERFIHDPSPLPPLLRIGLIHYQFEAIHPFLDGNGRVGRLLIILLMLAWGLLPQPLLYLSVFFEARRQEYYDRLLAVSCEGDWEGWLTFFLIGVHEQAEEAARCIDRLETLRRDYQARFGSRRDRAALTAALDVFIARPIASINQVQQALGLKHYLTAQRTVKKLEALGLVREATGRARGRLYRADEVLRALEQTS